MSLSPDLPPPDASLAKPKLTPEERCTRHAEPTDPPPKDWPALYAAGLSLVVALLGSIMPASITVRAAALGLACVSAFLRGIPYREAAHGTSFESSKAMAS